MNDIQTDVAVDSGEEEDAESHNKLLNAVSQLYNKQRVRPPKRKEPSSQISEFHLSNESETNPGGKLFISDLLKGLKKSSHKDIGAKVKVLQTKSKPLPKPVEKIHADKIKRVVGYEEVKKNLSRWEAIVQRNRAATQLKFPLMSSQLDLHNKLDSDFMSTFSTPTDLEKEMDAILNSSKTAQEDKKVEEDAYPLTVQELIEKRRMIAKIRARESFRIAKAARQNKIKSKKYHRILKRERIKQELKDFEELQKTDPEAALEKLEKIERARAEERMTLRHRNTGKWAKSQAVRAKYDSEARKQLAEQLAVSRDLTKKVVQDESGSEEEAEIEEDETKYSSSNPWVKKSESEIDAFISGYKKYWEKKALEEETPQPTQAEILAAYKAKSKDHFDSEQHKQDSSMVANVGPLTVDNVSTEKNNGKGPPCECETPSLEVHASSSDGDESKNVSNGNEKINLIDKSSHKKQKNVAVDVVGSAKSKETKEAFAHAKTVSEDNKPSILEEAEVSSGKSQNAVIECHFSVKRSKASGKKSPSNKRGKRKKSLVNVSGSWEIEEITPSFEGSDQLNPKKTKTQNLDEIFDKAEYIAQESIDKRVQKLKEDLNLTLHSDNPKSPAKDDIPPSDLGFKIPYSRSGFDNALMEISGDGIVPLQTDVRSFLKTKLSNDINIPNKAPDIDPSNFLPAKPTKLNSSIPRLVEQGEESDDEGDQEATEKAQQRLNLAEAFASDDIVDEFRKEKEEEKKASQPKDIDLTLPGWGSWAGFNLPVSQKKRKKFLFKMPKAPRKDDRKEHVIIRDDTHEKLRSHLVDELPFPFSRVKDYEATIRMPMGSTWVPQKAHKRLVTPPVVTKLGAIIKPMSEEQLFKKENKQLINLGESKG